MTLSGKDLAEITRLLEQSSFDEVHLEIDGLKLYLSRGTALPLAAAAPIAVPAATAVIARRESSADVGSSAHRVTAPMLGTFYRSPKPGAPPFVDVGARVQPDSIIGIIEVMKLMNTVRAGMHGAVAEILVTDGVMVEYGATLMRIDPAPIPPDTSHG